MQRDRKHLCYFTLLVLSRRLVKHKDWSSAPFSMQLWAIWSPKSFLLDMRYIPKSYTKLHSCLNFIWLQWQKCSGPGPDLPQHLLQVVTSDADSPASWPCSFGVCISNLFPWDTAVCIKHSELHLGFQRKSGLEYVKSYLLLSALQISPWASQKECPKLVESSDLCLFAVLWKRWSRPASP